jgi:hypothetical protein
VRQRALGGVRQSDQGEGVICSQRLSTQEAAHAVFNGEFTGFQSGGGERSIQLFKVSTVGALRILKDHDLFRIGVANQDSPSGV